MKQFVIIILVALCGAVAVEAQTFTDRLQTKNNKYGTIIIHHSDDIDELVNAGSLVPGSATPNVTVAGEDVPAAVTALTGKTYKADGYRVQVLAGGNSRADKTKATQAGNEVKANFPEQSVYVHFQTPRWICRVGNYRTYEEAHQMLLKVQDMGYKQATIVKSRITLKY